MPLPNPIVPSELQWAYRSGVERVCLRITTSAATDTQVAIAAGSKRIHQVTLVNLTQGAGVNATFDLSAVDPSPGGDTDVLWSGQVVPAGPVPVTQLIPAAGTTAGSNIDKNFLLFVLDLDNPDTDSLDLMVEIVYTPVADGSNVAVDADATVAAMTWP